MTQLTRLKVIMALAIFAGTPVLAIETFDYLSPTALVSSADGKSVYVACATANRILVFDVDSRKPTRAIIVPESPLGLALSTDGRKLYAACAAPESIVAVIDTAKGKVIEKLRAGHTASALALSHDGKIVFVCNRFNNEIAFLEAASGKVLKRVTVPREPISAALSLDGKHLLVANHIHSGPADADVVAASATVIDAVEGKVLQEINLPNGSGLLRDIRISPDGRHAVVAHQLSRFHLPTTQLERGWVNTSAFTIIDLATLRRVNTVLLDNIDSGAANPWGVAWTPDSKTLCVTHAGTHELSIIDFPALLTKLAALPEKLDPKKPADYTSASRISADVPNDLSFLVGFRQRVKLSQADRGPRAIAILAGKAWLANYFSDSLTEIDLAEAKVKPESIPLQEPKPLTIVRRGELLFNDATICFQGWQSCSSCHSSDARVDGLNWDNLNDGIGNPKNAKSLLQAHFTEPSMWLGVRSNAFVAVRAGIRNSMFTVRPPGDAEALDEYLKSLRPIPSPRLDDGKLSPAARRGKALFFSDAVACVECHKGAYYTDLKFHNVGTTGKLDQGASRFDTPSLVEVWRSAPYLHDGRAATIRDVLTTFNPKDEHGATARLTPQQLNDLIEFVLSL